MSNDIESDVPGMRSSSVESDLDLEDMGNDSGIPHTGGQMDQDRDSLTGWSDNTRVGDETSDRPTGDDPLIDTTSEKDYDV